MALFDLFIILLLALVLISALGAVIIIFTNKQEFPTRTEEFSREGTFIDKGPLQVSFHSGKQVGKRVIYTGNLWQMWLAFRGGDLRYTPFVVFFVSMYSLWFCVLLKISIESKDTNGFLSIFTLICALLVPIGAARQLRIARSRVS